MTLYIHFMVLPLFLLIGYALAADLNKYQIYYDVDCGGNDIGRQVNKDVAECHAICEADPDCVGGFVIDTADNSCYPKTACNSFSRKDKVDTYTLEREVCVWVPAGDCVDQFQYNGKTFEGCSYDNSASQPRCGKKAISGDSDMVDCEATCRSANKELQYGSSTVRYTRDSYSGVDSARYYNMVYKEQIHESGWLTAINIDVDAINRVFGIGIFRKVGTDICDFMLEKEVDLSRMSAYKPYRENYGVKQIKLNPEDWIPVSKDSHIGHLWKGQGTVPYFGDAQGVGYPMCGYDHNNLNYHFIPHETMTSTSNNFHRHYAFDVIIQYSDTDVSWLLNAALFKNVTSGSSTYSKKDGDIVFTDGDYSSCQDVGQNTFVVDLNRIVAVSSVKIRSPDGPDLSAVLRDAPGSGDSNACGMYNGDWARDSAVITCTSPAKGRYLELEFSNVQGTNQICEVEVTLSEVAEGCIAEQCYFITSEQADSPGAADEICKRHYASAAVFEPTDQSHWDSVATWAATSLGSFTDDSSVKSAVVGLKYWPTAWNAWKLQSTGGTIPSLTFDSVYPDYYTYAVMDTVSGKAVAEQSGVSHYCLCQVDKSVYDASPVTLLRAAADTSADTYDMWNTGDPIPALTEDYSKDLISTDVSATDKLLSPVVSCLDWSKVKEMRVSHYKDTMEVAYFVFGPGTGKDDWWTLDNLKGSSYHNLPVPDSSMADTVSMAGSSVGGQQYRFMLNQEVFGSDLSGWAHVTESGQFYYSNRGSASGSWKNADVFTISARIDKSNLGPGSVVTCEGVADGDYHSLLGCNVYVTCKDEILTYQTCRSGTQFDSDEGECISTSTTCKAGDAPKSCQSGCPADNPCVNGTCSHPDGATGWQCDCTAGFTGDLCETNIDDCEGVTCSSRGNCTDLVDDYTCVCEDDSGYQGKDCDENIDECSLDGFCVNGECTDSDGSYSCDCNDGYEGNRCDTDVDECAKNPCQHGTCSTPVFNDYHCDCSGTGYEGKNCDVVDYCHGHTECQNGAACVNGASYFNCTCEAGYSGHKCDEVDYCYVDNINCIHGECVLTSATSDGWQCECNDTHVGKLCDKPNPCYIDPCSNSNGTCHVNTELDDYYCDCGDFIGENCDIAHPCKPDPCEQGTCGVTGGVGDYGFECECALHYTGVTCSEDPCDRESCNDQGECEVDLTMQDGYTCTCNPGYSGTQCEQDPCHDQPCTGDQECTVDPSSSTGYQCSEAPSVNGAEKLGGEDTGVVDTGAVVGGLVGGICLILLVLLVIFLVRRKLKSNKQQQDNVNDNQQDSVETGGADGEVRTNKDGKPPLQTKHNNFM